MLVLSNYMKNKLSPILQPMDTCITYIPLCDEIDPWSIPFLSKHHFQTIYTLPQHAKEPPALIAGKLKNLYRDRSVCIFIPGTRFDRLGTRYGRGNGWFDRFLAVVPSEWVRIGITDSLHFLEIPLKRESWDQPVDWILCKNKNGCEVIETKARSQKSFIERNAYEKP